MGMPKYLISSWSGASPEGGAGVLVPTLGFYKNKIKGREKLRIGKPP